MCLCVYICLLLYTLSAVMHVDYLCVGLHMFVHSYIYDGSIFTENNDGNASIAVSLMQHQACL